MDMYSQYNGSWAESGAGWEQGGMLMDVECNEETITLGSFVFESA